MKSDEMRMVRDVAALPLIGMYEISKVLGSTLDLDHALHDVLNILSSYLQMRRGAVVLKDDQGRLTIAAVAGMSLVLAREGVLRYPLAAVEKVVATSIPMVVPDAEEEPLLADYLREGEGLEGEPMSFLCVPIKTTGKPFGALSVERGWERGANHVFEHDLRFLTMVATLIAQTVSLHGKVAADRERLMEQNARLHKRVTEAAPTASVQGLADVIGTSAAMARVYAQVRQAAPAKATVLLRGESGTGKELVARAVHALSPRASKAFVKLNCAALAESVLESELFGHEKGAFTGAVGERKGRFELAHGGTLFLDEIGEISAAFQAKLLRVLQEGEFERVGGSKTVKVDVRLVAATNRDLETAVAKGEFRADLYYRLNVVPIFLPALRERGGDIPLLAAHFLHQFNAENGRELALADEVVRILQGCRFPGNVRELENCITRAATMCKSDTICPGDLSCVGGTCLSSQLWDKRPAPAPAPHPAPPPATAAAAPPSPPPPAADPGSDPDIDGLVDRERLVQAMERCGWVQAKAARLLGLTPRQVGYALKKYGIEVERL
ncbi:MAG: nif-specific transcriptional activator NifA [Actinomycetota bacterium]